MEVKNYLGKLAYNPFTKHQQNIPVHGSYGYQVESYSSSTCGKVGKQRQFGGASKGKASGLSVFRWRWTNKKTQKLMDLNS